jgi:hypothetical protein
MAGNFAFLAICKKEHTCIYQQEYLKKELTSDPPKSYRTVYCRSLIAQKDKTQRRQCKMPLSNKIDI